MLPYEKPFFLKEALFPGSKASMSVINRTNYEDMKIALTQAFGNETILLQASINELIGFLLEKPGDNSAENLRKIHSDLLTYISYLKSKTKSSAELGNVLMSSLFLQRLPYFTRTFLTEKNKGWRELVDAH